MEIIVIIPILALIFAIIVLVFQIRRYFAKGDGDDYWQSFSLKPDSLSRTEKIIIMVLAILLIPLGGYCLIINTLNPAYLLVVFLGIPWLFLFCIRILSRLMRYVLLIFALFILAFIYN